METKQGEMANDEAGCRTLLLQRLIQIEPQLIVMEVTGGLETLIVSTLAAAGLPTGRPRAVTGSVRVKSATLPRPRVGWRRPTPWMPRYWRILVKRSNRRCVRSRTKTPKR